MTLADKVAAHIASLSDWQYASSGLPYGHMGATLTDAVLQSGITYDTVVLHRVNRILLDFPNATTTSAFAEVLRHHGASAVLQWNGEKKPRTLNELVSLLLSTSKQKSSSVHGWSTTAT